MVKHKKITLALILIVPCLMIAGQFALLNNQFCYDTYSFMTERQILDRLTFGEHVDQLSEEEKNEILDRNGYTNYPYNCAFTPHALGESGLNRFLNGLLGRKFFSLECVNVENNRQDLKQPYYDRIIAVNTCGESGDQFGDAISKEYFYQTIERNKQYWQRRKEKQE